jgi:hypothetical protein
MNIKQKFNSIDQSKLDSKQVEILKNIEQKTDGFKTKDKEVISKIDMALDKIISALKEKNPEAIKSKKRTTSKTKTQKSSGGGKRTLFTIAKEIRKSDETWEQAKSRAKKIMEEENKQTTQKMKTETEKLLAFIKRKKELDGLSGTSIKKDSKVEALPKGRRVSKKGWKNQYGESEGGKVYYENRDNRTDRLAPNFSDKIYLANGGAIIGTPETPLARDLGIDYTGLVGETGAMSSGEMFADGGATGLPAGAEQHFVNYYLGEGTAQGIYAMGGSLDNHGLKQGDQIIKTMSGGVQKVKTKSGDTVYVDLANGYRGAEPPLPFLKGGSLGEELMGGQSNATLKPSGYHLVSAKGREIIVSDDGGNSKERWVKNNGFSGYRLVYKGNDYEFTDSFDDGGETKRNLSRDRMFKNNSQKYEVSYSKNKPNRRGYGYAHGGYVTITNPTEQLFKKGYRIYGGDSWETFEDVKRAYADMNLKDKMIVKVVTNNNTYFAIAEKERSFAEGGFMTDPTFGDFQNQVYDGGGEMNSDKETMIYANQLLRRAVMKGDLTQEEANSALAYEIAEDEVEDFIDDDMEEMGSSDFGYMYRNFINSYNEVKAKSFATGGGVGKKKTPKQLRNEYLEKLGSKEADVWDKIGAESGSQIRNSDKMLKAYAEGVEEMLQKEGVGKGSFDQEDYDFYTDENWHLFNEFLVWNSYYEPEMTKTEKAWREKMYEEDMREKGKSNYVSNPSIISLSGSSKSKSKSDKYIVRADIKEVKVKTDAGYEYTFKGSDVLNGVNVLEKGSLLKNNATYVAKRNIIHVELKNGEKVKPANGYWIKKDAKGELFKPEKKEEYKVMSNQAIFPKKGVGTYWYVENSKGQTINKNTGKPYKGKEMTNYYFLNEDGAKKFAEKLNSSTFEGGGSLDGVKLDFDFDTEGDFDFDYPQEVEKIKLLKSKVDFDKVVGSVDYGKTIGNTNLKFYKNGTLIMTLKGDYNTDTETLDTELDILGVKKQINYHPYGSMGGVDFSNLQKQLDGIDFKKILNNADWLNFIKDNKSYFDIEEQSDDFIQLTTRENGSVGDEEYGIEDIEEAKSIVKKIKEKYPKTKVSIYTVDEFVYLELEVPKEFEGGGKIQEIKNMIIVTDANNNEYVYGGNGSNELGYLVPYIDVSGRSKKYWEHHFIPKETWINIDKIKDFSIYPISKSDFKKLAEDNKKEIEEILLKFKSSFYGGGKTTFKEKSSAIAKKFEGKKVEPKYQKEYGKTYDKAEAKEVGNKIAGSMKAKYDSKMSGGGSTKRGGSMVLAKQIRKEGESWASALKRANEQIKNK